MDDAKVVLNCPGCYQSLSFPVADIGTIQECPHCGGYVDVPGGPDPILSNDADYDRQVEEYDRQTEESARQLEVGKRQQEATEQQIQKEAKLLDQQSEILGKWDQIADRANDLLSKWTSMTERFDAYLAGLEKEDQK